MASKLIDASDEINQGMPSYVIEKLSLALNSRQKTIAKSRVLVLGLAYKANVDDVRESPSAEILKLLTNLEADALYSDPYVLQFPAMRNYNFDMASVEISAELLASCDAVIVATDHDAFDYDLIRKHSDIIIDARGVYRGLNQKVFRA